MRRRKNESITHKRAKNIISNHLNKNLQIEALCKCSVCYKTGSLFLFLESGYIAEEEKYIQGIKPDISITCGGNLIGIIEIYHKHRQSDRPEPWFEFRAKDIANWNGVLPLKDSRKDRKCNSCINLCRGKCYSFIDSEWMQIEDCNCSLVTCKNCNLYFPEWVVKRKVCLNCRIKTVKYCGECNNRGKIKKFSYCKHYCCVECYYNLDKCKRCNKSI